MEEQSYPLLNRTLAKGVSMATPCLVSYDGGKTWVEYKPKPKSPRVSIQRDATGKYFVNQGLK